MTPHLHPKSWEDLRALVWLHGGGAIIAAVHIIQHQKMDELAKKVTKS